MATSKQIALRWALLLFLVGMLAYLPTREFLKITVLLGAPFVLVLGFMLKKRPYSLPYIISILLLVVIVAGYGFMLYGLPGRIQSKQIITQGTKLISQKRYEEAKERFRDLESLGRSKDMRQLIEMAEREALADQMLSQARELYQGGKQEQALDLLEAVPEGTQAAGQANKLKKEWEGRR